MQPRIIAIVLTVVLLASAMLVVPSTNASGGQAKWRYLLYLAADNNLDTSAGRFHVPVVESDFDELMSVGSTEDIAVYILVDRLEGPANLFRVEKNSMTEITDFELNDKEVNMGDPMTLRSFVSYTYAAAPADHTVLIMWDHGWPEYAAVDDNADLEGNGDILTHFEVIQALSGYKVDIIGFDECLVGNLETVYEYAVSGVQTDYMLVSETYTGWRGFPYDWTLREMVENPDMTSREVAEMFIEQTSILLNQKPYQAEMVTCHGAIDLSQVRQLGSSVLKLADILYSDMKTNYKVISKARGYSQFSYGSGAINFLDLKLFVERISRFSEAKDVKQACEEILEAFDATVIAMQVTHAIDTMTYGLSVVLPNHERETPEFYYDFAFSSSGWLDFLDAYWSACGNS